MRSVGVGEEGELSGLSDMLQDETRVEFRGRSLPELLSVCPKQQRQQWHAFTSRGTSS